MNKNATTTNKESIENWRDKKFGMFVHYGLYSVQGRGEWAMFIEQQDIDEYKKLANEFTAEKFNGEEWAKIAKNAGMQYMVLTTKHHDGFSLWDSKSCKDDHTVMNSACKRDLIKEYTDACRNNGLMVGLYYSPLDWRFPGFFAPKLYRTSAKELVKQTHDQIRELLTGYGKIDLLWFDGAEDFWVAQGLHLNRLRRPDDFKTNIQVEDFWRAKELDKFIRETQKGIICNDRIGDKSCGDYFAPEKKIGEYNVVDPWETCDTLTDDWGYRPNAKIRSLRNVINLLVKVVCNGGNLLLNVAPRPDGSFEPEEIKRLKQVGEWLKKYGDSIYGTRGGPIICDDFGGTTHKQNKLYFHVLDWQQDQIVIPDVGDPEIKFLTNANYNVVKEGGLIKITVSEEDKLEMDSIIEFTYDKPVKEIFPEDVDYKELSKKRTYNSDAIIVDDVK